MPSLTLTELVVAALAAWQAVEAWRHSALTAELRARVALWEPGGAKGLLSCPYCLSVWAGGVAALAAVLPWPSGLSAWAVAGAVALAPAKLALWALAVSRLANLGNDLAHAACRTPRTDTGVFARRAGDAAPPGAAAAKNPFGAPDGERADAGAAAGEAL